MATQSPEKDKRSIQMQKDRLVEKERLRAAMVARNARKSQLREAEQMNKLSGRRKKSVEENQTYVN